MLSSNRWRCLQRHVFRWKPLQPGTRHRLFLPLPQNASFDTTVDGVTSTLAIRDADVGIPID